MKENENKKSVRVTDGTLNEVSDVLKDNNQNKIEKLKKPLIFGLMGIVFAGCLYLIFKPAEDKKKTEEIGLNDAVPQATDAGLQSDKQKAYEQAILDQKTEEKKNSLTSLSDYWNNESAANPNEEPSNRNEEQGYGATGGTKAYNNPALTSYKSAQSTLGSFYHDDNSETNDLRKQVDELRKQLTDQRTAPAPTVDDQLALMEKSYQMAAKYLPTGSTTSGPPGTKDIDVEVSSTKPAPTARSGQKESFVSFTPARKNAVSALYREPSDSVFLASMNENRNRGFYTAGVSEQVVQPKNSIRAVIQETQEVTGESGVRIRLLEAAKTSNRTIPQGTVLSATAKFQQGRLQLEITSVELEGNIIPVSISIYDIDGQKGLYVPYSPEMNALSEIAANMSQASATSIMMTSSAGQQIAGDLTRGVVQGVSGYFSKKIRTPKVTLKAGHQVFLLSKN
ncbi:conjugative transposon protein TraM [Sphingobacterium siyangense]|uniref:Conjugative transposon TraM protein n=1 Tax=Sphingobacterium siyangense TaxID=459529 RepID=A0A562MK57_9SPHI|nr:conjugative transposon protein TraM [Sphingobacterium siyangense]TWI20315.1 conjugative transposon TraM protein [Sphingobacterium siyangense]